MSRKTKSRKIKIDDPEIIASDTHCGLDCPYMYQTWTNISHINCGVMCKLFFDDLKFGNGAYVRHAKCIEGEKLKWQEK